MKLEKAEQTIVLPPAPSHLSAESRELWQEVVELMAAHHSYTGPVRVITPSPGRLALLTIALEARDRAAQASRQIDKDGLTSKTETTGTIHAHPLLKVEKDSMALFQRCWSSLKLDWNNRLDGGNTV
jgi:P27 family predicted phage terminase small subunit